MRGAAVAAVAVGLCTSAVTYAQEGAARDDAATGAAAEAGRHVTEGRRLYTELDFPASVDAMRRALAVPGIPDALRLEALEYLGSAYVVLEQPADARQAFLAMLELDPYHAVREPSGAPKIARFVEELRATVVDDAALDRDARLRPRLPRAGRVGRPTPVRFEPSEGSAVAAVAVFVRGVGEHDYDRVETELDDRAFVTELPARSAPDELELYAEGRDARGRVVTRAGEPLAPLALSIRPAGREAEGASVLERWWFWTGIGVLLAGGIVLGIALGGGENAPAGTLPPGRVELP